MKHVFISHSGKDKAPLIKLKHLLETNYPGKLQIFLSSDGSSIRLGKNWSKEIEDGLDKSELALVVLTRNSINNDWVNFETGYIYAKKSTKMIPVVFGDLTMEELTPPINLIQAMYLNNENGLIRIQQEILQTLGLQSLREFDASDYFDIFHEKQSGNIEEEFYSRIVIRIKENDSRLMDKMLAQFRNVFDVRSSGGSADIQRYVWPGGSIQRNSAGDLVAIIGAINMDESIALLRIDAGNYLNDIKTATISLEMPAGYKVFENDYDVYALAEKSEIKFLDDGILEYKSMRFTIANRVNYRKLRTEDMIEYVGVDVHLHGNMLGLGIPASEFMKELCEELYTSGLVFAI